MTQKTLQKSKNFEKSILRKTDLKYIKVPKKCLCTKIQKLLILQKIIEKWRRTNRKTSNVHFFFLRGGGGIFGQIKVMVPFSVR